LIELCPDADLNSDVVVAATPAPKAAVKAAPTAVAQKPAGTKPVTVRLDDEDEEEDVAPARTTTRSAKVNAAADDDFLAEADALLNS
jgi:hypothetical protein